MLVLGAGTATTTRALNLVTYYVLANPEIEERLRKEIKDFGVTDGYPGKMPKWLEVEKLPYLAACIKEGLRYVVLSTNGLLDVAMLTKTGSASV